MKQRQSTRSALSASNTSPRLRYLSAEPAGLQSRRYVLCEEQPGSSPRIVTALQTRTAFVWEEEAATAVTTVKPRAPACNDADFERLLRFLDKVYSGHGPGRVG